MISFKTKSELKMFAEARLVYKGPDKPAGGRFVELPEEKITPGKEYMKERERINKLLAEYERQRKNVLGVIDDFKKKDDVELRTKALQYENKILNETRDPQVLRVLKDLSEEQIKENLAKLSKIIETEMKRDELLAEWMQAREREKIAEGVERYNYMRRVSIDSVKSLEKYFFPKQIYESLLSELSEGLPELKPDEVKSRQELRVAILEVSRVMEKYRKIIDEARDFRHKEYETAFYHAVGRAVERMPDDVKQDPKKIEAAVNEMIGRISSVDLSKIPAADAWSVGQYGLTFNIRKTGKQFMVVLADASPEIRKKYSKVAAYLEGHA